MSIMNVIKKESNWITGKLLPYILKRVLFICFQIIYPVNTKWIMFEAYCGKDQDGYSCNTKAMYEAMLYEPEYAEYTFIWSFQHPEKFQFLKENPNTVIIKRAGIQYLKFCARAGYLFTNMGVPWYICPSRRQKLIFTWHGKPLKRIGCSFEGKTDGRRSKWEITSAYIDAGRKLTILLSPAPVFTPIMADAYHLSSSKRKTAILESGYPRNDFLFKYTEKDVLRVKTDLQIPLDKKIILYAPTWRPFEYLGGGKYKHTQVLDIGQLKTDLGSDYIVLCRLHIQERGSMQFDQYPDFLLDVSEVRDVNELYIISDLLVSDYSGTIFDYANLRRPIVLYMYDLEKYLNDANGLNFKLDFLPGPIVKDQRELVEAIKYEMKHFVYEGKYQTFNETCNCMDGPDCAIRTIKQIVKNASEWDC